MRTFCVLTQSAREDPFCDGVFEDGIRVLHDGRLTPTLFSRVLSPAHDLARLVVGPLVASLQEKRPAVLVVGLPGLTVTSSDSDPAASPAREAAEKIADCCEVAINLYDSLLQLLFTNLPDCLGATCSVVTTSANDRWLYDGIQGKRVRTLEEVEWLTVDRAAPSDEGFEVLLDCLARRHDGLQFEVNSLASETACVVTLHMEPYAPLILVDVGSDQDVLQQLTLILGMWGACGRRTYPPRSSPLVSLLQEYVIPEASLHVVIAPEPSSSPRDTMRLVRFASGLEAHRQESLVLSSTSAMPRGETSTLSSARSTHAAASPMNRRRRAAVVRGTNNAAGRPSVTTRSSSVAGGSRVSTVRKDDRLAAQQRAVKEALSANASSATLTQQPPPRASHSEPRADDEVPSASPVSATTAPTVGPLAPSNDHLLSLRIRTLETALEDVKDAYTREHARCVRLETEVQALRSDADARDAKQNSQTHELEKLRSDNAEFAELVPRLLKKVSALEKAKAAWEAQRKTITHDKDAAQQRVEELQTLVTHLRKRVSQQEHLRAVAARENTLRGVLDNVAQIAGQNARAGRTARGAKQTSRDTSRQARGSIIVNGHHDHPRSESDSEDSESSEDGGQPLSSATSKRAWSRHQLERLHAVTVDELRRRNAALEKEVARLRHGGEAAGSHSAATLRDPREPPQTSTAPPDVAENAPFLRERLEYFMTELSHARQEKDSLIRYIIDRGGRPAQPPSDNDHSGAFGGALHSSREDADGNVRSYQETGQSAPHRQQQEPSLASSTAEHTRVEAAPQTAVSSPTATPPTAAVVCPICAVVAALQAGCSSLLAVQDGMLAEVERDPDGTAANGLTAHALNEHSRATSALRLSLSETASRAINGIQHDPHTVARPLPPVANMANSATLSAVLSLESERAARLASFVPAFTQLAVATDNLLMRVPRPQS